MRWPYYQSLYEFSLKHNIALPLILLVVAYTFKILDIFVFHVDELLGEIIVSKSIGFAMIVFYLWAVGKSVEAIGLHGREVSKALIIGAAGVAIILSASYGLQFGVLTEMGEHPFWVITAIDPRTGMGGGLAFALFLVLGNFVNSFMEEGLFRGIMLRHFRRSLSFWRANTLQAILFGIWHLTIPVKGLLTGQMSLEEATSQAAIMTAGTFMFGLAMGYLYLKTDNLWAPWVVHTINNTVQNMIHVSTAGGIDTGIIFYLAIGIGIIMIIFFYRRMTLKFQMPEVRPWS